jgi:hypothetical protein
MNSVRPSSRATAVALTAGTIASVSLFVAGFALRLAGQDAIADTAATGAVIVLMITPAAGLVATAFELRTVQRTAALLGLLVLAILVVASVLALAGLH